MVVILLSVGKKGNLTALLPFVGSEALGGRVRDSRVGAAVPSHAFGRMTRDWRLVTRPCGGVVDLRRVPVRDRVPTTEAHAGVVLEDEDEDGRGRQAGAPVTFD